LAINFGAHFQEENSMSRDSTFIANIDSGDGSTNMDPFIQWLLAVIYKLEVWVTQLLNTSALDLIVSPYLANIGQKCKRQIQSKEHIVCSIPITAVTRAPTQEDTCNCGIYSLITTRAAFLGDQNHHVRWNKVHNAHALWTLVLKPFWELPKKQRRVRLEELITKFRFNFYTLLREQLRGLTKRRPYRDRPYSSLSPLATAPSTRAVANDTDMAANEITPADNNTMSSDPDSDDVDDEGGKYITASVQADKPFAGMFSTHLKEKATRSAMVSKQTRLQRGRWREKSAEMMCKERQEYFKVKHQQVDEKALMSTQPQREAKMETKRKNREWSENSKVIKGIFRKPAKLLQKEKKQVAQLLDEKFSQNEPAGETPDKSVSQISHLKYVPPLKRAFTAKERNVRRKSGLINKGYEMHLSAYYQGLTIDKKGNRTWSTS
jgi:hypothetical protein